MNNKMLRIATSSTQVESGEKKYTRINKENNLYALGKDRNTE